MIYYVALPFVRVEEGLAPGEAVGCPHSAAAIRRAEAMAAKDGNAGAVAFSREGLPRIWRFRRRADPEGIWRRS